MNAKDSKPWLQLTIYGALCATSTFIINGIEADSEDFGEQYDNGAGSAQPYGCGNMTFTPSLPKDEVLAKYKITASQYKEIAEKLEEALSFGPCGWCV